MDALMRPRIFVTQPIAVSALKRLRAVAAVKVNPDSSRVPAKRELIAAARSCDILFGRLHDKIDRDVLAANPRLKALCSMTITPDNIDVAAATELGIIVTVVPAMVVEATADIAFGLILAVARRMLEGDRLLRKGGFPGAQSNHLAGSWVYGKTIGLIGGGGRIGKAVARRAHGFSMRVLYWTPRRKSEEEERQAGIAYVPLEQLLAESDFVSLHCPMRPETRHLIGARELKTMKKSAYLINTARGPVVDEAALARALTRGQIAGAGLDVFEHEPKVEPALKKLNNVVLTPHLGSAVAELREQMAHVVVDNILAVLETRRPPNCINPEVLGDGAAARPAMATGNRATEAR
jgi:glyoxylate reductase